MKIKTETIAYVTGHNQESFARAMLDKDYKLATDFMTFNDTVGMEEVGWVNVGKAHIVVDMAEDEVIRENAVLSLKEQRKTILAEAQMKAMAIDEKIQNLLAIEYSGERYE